MNTFNADDDVYEEMRPVHVECDKPARIPAELNRLKMTRIRFIFLQRSSSHCLQRFVGMWFAAGVQGQMKVFVEEFQAFLLWWD